MVTETHLIIKLHIYEYIAWLVSNYHSKVIKTDKFSINLNSLPTATVKRGSHLKLNSVLHCGDRLCGLVVRVSGYRYRGPGFDPRRYQIF